MPNTKVMPVKSFTTPQEWALWLVENHSQSTGLWLLFYKKGAAKKTISYDQALNEALCYGWIDGQIKKINEVSWMRRFTPRRTKSIWSKRNQEHIRRLTQENRMQPAGLAAVAAAKADGRWDQAFDRKNFVVPADFLAELEKDPVGQAFFKTLNRANVYTIVWKLQTAKQAATRARRIQVILDMLQQGKKFL